MIKVLNAVLAIVAGVGGALLLYWLLNKFAERLPGSWEDRVKPWVFVGPAVVVIGLFLIYPALRTLVLSFANADSTAWVGFSNYADLLSSRDFIFVTLLNTLLWIAVVPVAVVVIGLFVAVLADRLGPRTEKATKSVIFLPMAISMVGAATTVSWADQWRTPASMQTSTISSAPTTAASARVGITDTSWASSRAGAGSRRSRSSTRFCTAPAETPSAPFISSVTSSGLPPASR